MRSKNWKIELNNEFPEVCGRQLLATKWYAQHFTYLADKEPIHIKEMRGDLKALYTKLIDPSNWNLVPQR